MLGQLLRIQLDAHRHALHDLDPVAAGVLRRQQRERAAGAEAEAGDLAVVFDIAAVEVGMHFDRLADAHLGQLGFLEVGFHPDLFQRHDGHQRRARLHALAQLHLALGDVAGHRRDDRRALQVQIGLAQLRSGGLHLRLLRRAWWRRPARGCATGCRASRSAPLRRRRACRAHAPVPRWTPRRWRPGRCGASTSARACATATWRARDVGLAGIDRCCTGRAPGARCRRGWRRPVVGDLRIVGIQVHQRLAGFHLHAVVGIDADHRAAGLRHDADHVALHVGVVGVLVPARIQEVVGQPGDGADDHDDGDDQQCALALAVLRREPVAAAGVEASGLILEVMG